MRTPSDSPGDGNQPEVKEWWDRWHERQWLKHGIASMQDRLDKVREDRFIREKEQRETAKTSG
tara:strand:+ start:1499 stop:1687 length:189 start_codon:yes stop_codon:yes gene_type:complete